MWISDTFMAHSDDKQKHLYSMQLRIDSAFVVKRVSWTQFGKMMLQEQLKYTIAFNVLAPS